MKEIISIDRSLELHLPDESDVSAIVKALQDREIYERTIMIPFPYCEKDGKEFVEICSKRCARYGHPMDWGIYKLGTGLIGMIGFTEETSVIADTKGVGYWLAKAYWGQGIMTQTLRKITELGFKQYGFKRLEMPIFSFNIASCRVAEKCGYHCEKDLPAAYQKDGKMIDAKLYVVDKGMKASIFEHDTGIVLDIPEPVAGEIRRIRKKYDRGLDPFPAEITVAGSSGVGWLASGQNPEEVFAVLNRVAASQTSIEVRFEGVRCFPKTRLFYLAVADPQPFIRLHERIANSGLKFNTTPYPYTPHCTLAGLKENDAKNAEVIRREVYPKAPFFLTALSVYEVSENTCMLRYRVALSGK